MEENEQTINLSGAMGSVSMWAPTTTLRWLKKTVTLQQLWGDALSGKIEWRDVPIVDE